MFWQVFQGNLVLVFKGFSKLGADELLIFCSLRVGLKQSLDGWEGPRQLGAPPCFFSSALLPPHPQEMGENFQQSQKFFLKLRLVTSLPLHYLQANIIFTISGFTMNLVAFLLPLVGRHCNIQKISKKVTSILLLFSS